MIWRKYLKNLIRDFSFKQRTFENVVTSSITSNYVTLHWTYFDFFQFGYKQIWGL